MKVMRFFFFGRVRVVGADGAEIRLGKKPQKLLGLLMLASNRTVPSDVLVDYLWGEQLPANPANSLQDLVKRLRIALCDESHTVIVTKGSEYGLIAEPKFLDVALFRRLTAAGLALATAEPATSKLLLSHALEMWVGDPPDFRPGSRASDEMDQLYDLRLVAVNAVERISGLGREQTPIDEDFQALPAHKVGLALNLLELDELVLAEVIACVARHQGRIHRMSGGLLLASFPWGRACIRASGEIAECLADRPDALVGGAVDHMPAGVTVRSAERLLQLARLGRRQRILVTRRVHESASNPVLTTPLHLIDDEPQGGEPGCVGARSDVPMIGRDQTMLEVADLVRRHKLVTLRGPGGIGKTRLAREIGKILGAQFADGVSIVDLSEADRHGDPVSLVIRTLALVPEPYRRPQDTLVDRLARSQRLLILDNCEEFIEDVRSLCEGLMHHCPDVKIVATSRSSIGITREAVYQVGELDDASAAQLLVSLAFPSLAEVKPAPSDSKVLKLCSLLDNIPLAIECAAAMVRTMGLEPATTALGSLPDGTMLPLLDAAHGGRGRHPSIELALNVSCQCLCPEELRLFERLSSLRGGFSTEDAVGVASDADLASTRLSLVRLCDASLLKRLGDNRWRMLEPVRQFAATRLLRRGEQAIQSARHSRHFVRLAKQAEINLKGPEEGACFALLSQSYANLVKALSWAVESGDCGAALELTSSLWWYWAARGMFVEGAEAVERSIALQGCASSALRAKALVAASHLAWWAGDPHRTETSLTEAMQLLGRLRRADSETARLEAWARTGLAAARMWGGGDYEVLKVHLEKGLKLFSSIGDLAGAALNLSAHSGIAWHHGHDQIHHFKACEALAAFEAAGHQTMIAHSKRVVGLAKAGLGESEQGRPLIVEGLRLSQELGDIGGLPLGLCFLGLADAWGGHRSRAVQAFRQSILINRNVGQVWPILLAVEFASEEACLRGRPEDGMRLNAVAVRLTARTGIRMPPGDSDRVRRVLRDAAQVLPSDVEAKVRDEGSEMTLGDATALALKVFEH